MDIRRVRVKQGLRRVLPLDDIDCGAVQHQYATHSCVDVRQSINSRNPRTGLAIHPRSRSRLRDSAERIAATSQRLPCDNEKIDSRCYWVALVEIVNGRAEFTLRK